MAEGRERANWQHTSAILAFMAEPHRDRKKRSRPFRPADFNPYCSGRKRRSGISRDRFIDGVVAEGEKRGR